MITNNNLDLSTVEACRFYLENMTWCIDGEDKKVTEFTLESGKKIGASDMSDSQLIQYANQLYNEIDLPSQKAGKN